MTFLGASPSQGCGSWTGSEKEALTWISVTRSEGLESQPSDP
jgi:hypothetical protein